MPSILLQIPTKSFPIGDLLFSSLTETLASVEDTPPNTLQQGTLERHFHESMMIIVFWKVSHSCHVSVVCI